MEKSLCLLTGRPYLIPTRYASDRTTKAMDYRPMSTASITDNSKNAATGYDSLRLPQLQEYLPYSENARISLDSRLDTITGEVLMRLYSSSTVNYSWTYIQRTVLDLHKKLSEWSNGSAAGIISVPSQERLPSCSLSYKDRKYLALRYHGIGMLINKPFLCESPKKIPSVPHQAEVLGRNDADVAALRCISAARNLLQILPRNISAAELYNTTPWWFVLHYIIQAGVVLITEISFQASHSLVGIDTLISESALVLRWLLALSPTSLAAQRAWLSLSRLMRLALSKANKDAEVLSMCLATEASTPHETSHSMPTLHGKGLNCDGFPVQWPLQESH